MEFLLIVVFRFYLGHDLEQLLPPHSRTMLSCADQPRGKNYFALKDHKKCDNKVKNRAAEEGKKSHIQ
jgi:hypothetical protein